MTNVLEQQSGRPFNRQAGEGLDYVAKADDPQDTVRYGVENQPYPTIELVIATGVVKVGDGSAPPTPVNSSPGTASAVIPFQIPFERDGSLAGLEGLTGFDHAPVGFTATLTSVEVFVGDSPGGADLIVDVHKATTSTSPGVTVFTDQSKRPRISPGEFYVKVTDIDVTAFDATDFLVVAVDQTGALNTEGADLRVWARFITETEGSPGFGLSVPHGGNTGDRLTKLSDADGDYGWASGAPGDTDTRLTALETAIDGGTPDAIGTQITVRHGIAADWATFDPVLAVGELGYETDTGLFKIGDGTSFFSALSYANDAQGSVFSTDLALATRLYAGAVEPATAGYALSTDHYWLDDVNAAFKKWNGSSWDIVIQAAGTLDATDIGYDNAPYTNAGEALDALVLRDTNFDNPGHFDRGYKTNGDTPEDNGATPTVGDWYVDLATGVVYDYVPDITGAPASGFPPDLSGNWITGGIVDEAWIDVDIARKTYVDSSIASALAGLNTDVIEAMFARTVTLTGGSGGTFTLTYQGQTTAGIAYDASAATVASAVQALSTVTTATGTGGPMNTAPVVIKIDAASEDGSAMTGSAASVTGSPVFSIAAAFDVSNKIDKSVMTSGGDLITRQSGVPVRITRAALAADTAWASLYAPIDAVDTITGRSFSAATDLLASDAGKYVASNGTSGFQLVTVLHNDDEPIDVFKVFEVRQTTDAPCLIAFASGVAYNSLNDQVALAGKGAAVRLHKTSTNGWFLTGGLAP